ncbi:MAG TPA: hypothetical protein VG454_10735 [Gemmatimonadales bacterium]|nr:hypothetical protein [Gemmatimonadales bacterium]
MIRTSLVGALLLIPGALAAQDNTAELLDRAARFHADLDVERELVLLRQVISPNSPFIVTHEQRVFAYKYLGAALVVLGQVDSGVVYFRAALERDPFVDLEPQKFTPAELAAFATAKRLTFGLGARQVTPATIDPRTERVNFTVLSTHAATLQVEVRAAGAPAGVVVFSGENDGPRELQWDGLMANGHLAESGRYELFVLGVSRLTQRTDSARAYFSIQQDYPALEDTLPALGAADLLPEQHPPSAARAELFKGLGLGAAALVISGALANGDLEGGSGKLAAGVAITASAVGIAGFIHGRRHREIPANVAINAQRQAARASANAAVVQRNKERLAQARLVIAPAAGVGP